MGFGGLAVGVLGFRVQGLGSKKYEKIKCNVKWKLGSMEFYTQTYP